MLVTMLIIFGILISLMVLVLSIHLLYIGFTCMDNPKKMKENELTKRGIGNIMIVGVSLFAMSLPTAMVLIAELLS